MAVPDVVLVIPISQAQFQPPEDLKREGLLS